MLESADQESLRRSSPDSIGKEEELMLFLEKHLKNHNLTLSRLLILVKQVTAVSLERLRSEN